MRLVYWLLKKDYRITTGPKFYIIFLHFKKYTKIKFQKLFLFSISKHPFLDFEFIRAFKVEKFTFKI